MPKLKDVTSKEDAYFIINVEAEAVNRLKDYLDTKYKDERTASERNKDTFFKETKWNTQNTKSRKIPPTFNLPLQGLSGISPR